MPDRDEAPTPAPPSGPRRSNTAAKVTGVAGAIAALVGLGYILTGSAAVIDFVLFFAGLLLLLAGMVRLLRRSPGI